MAASGKKLGLDPVMQGVTAAYLNGLAASLEDINFNSAIVDTNVFNKMEENGAQATLADIEKGGFFNEGGKLVNDFPTDPTKMQRFRDLMKTYCGESKELTDKEQFLLVCANFQAAQKTSKEHLDTLIHEAVTLAKQANQMFKEVQFHVLRAVSRRPFQERHNVIAHFNNPKAIRELIKVAQVDASFILELGSHTKIFATYKQHILNKAKADYQKQNAEGKEKNLEQAASISRTSDAAIKETPQTKKYQRAEEATKAIDAYTLNHDLDLLVSTISRLGGEEQKRLNAKNPFWNTLSLSHHPLSGNLNKLLDAARAEQAKRRDLATASPTETPPAAPVSGSSSVAPTTPAPASELESDGKKDKSPAPRPV